MKRLFLLALAIGLLLASNAHAGRFFHRRGGCASSGQSYQASACTVLASVVAVQHEPAPVQSAAFLSGSGACANGSCGQASGRAGFFRRR